MFQIAGFKCICMLEFKEGGGEGGEGKKTLYFFFFLHSLLLWNCQTVVHPRLSSYLSIPSRYSISILEESKPYSQKMARFVSLILLERVKKNLFARE